MLILLRFLLLFPLFWFVACSADSDIADTSTGPSGTVPEAAQEYEITGQRYFVDAIHGSDENPGTSLEPFQSLEYALSQVNAGDALLLRDGNYGDLVFGAEHNAPIPEVFTDWVTIKADSGHTPELGNVDLGIWNRNGYLLEFSEVGNSDLYLRLDGLRIQNQLSVKGSRHVDIRNCEISTDTTLEGLTASGACVEMLNGQNNSLLNNEIYHCGVGVVVMTTDFVMKGNDIHHTSHDAIKLYGGENILIEGNVVHHVDDGLTDDDPDPDNRNNHADGLHMHTIIHKNGYSNPRWAGGADNVVIRGNIFYHIEAMAVMINQNDWDGSWGSFIWENNIFGPTGGRLFIQGSSFESFVFRHNTVLYAPNDIWTSMYGRTMEPQGLKDPNSATYHLQVWKNPAGHEYYNNILCEASASLTQDQGVVQNNIFISSAQAEDLVLPYVEIPGNIQDFIDDGGVLGELAAESPAVDGGVDSLEVFETDIYGTFRDSVPDIGAVEFTD